MWREILKDDRQGVAFVTGGGTGIGRAAARLLASRGYSVAILERDDAAGRETAAAIKSAGGECHFVPADVTDEDAVKAAMATTVARYGALDCAVNNAGIILPDDSVWAMDAFRKTMAVNVDGMMLCMKAQIDQMLTQKGGRIVNISSIGGLIASGPPSMPGYVTSKHAVIGLTRTAAIAYARQGIRVNAVCPGTTRTAMVENVMKISPEVRQKLENESPMGRLAEPEEIAEAIYWLCSERSSYVNGHALVVDGGMIVT